MRVASEEPSLGSAQRSSCRAATDLHNTTAVTQRDTSFPANRKLIMFFQEVDSLVPVVCLSDTRSCRRRRRGSPARRLAPCLRQQQSGGVLHQLCPRSPRTQDTVCCARPALRSSPFTRGCVVLSVIEPSGISAVPPEQR